MATKKNVKVRDMKPTKDAKGGGGHPTQGGIKPQGSGVNTTKPSGHHGHHAVN